MQLIEPDWRDLPRTKLIEGVICAVDCAKGEAVQMGDTNFVGHVDKVVLPFLEAELERAGE